MCLNCIRRIEPRSQPSYADRAAPRLRMRMRERTAEGSSSKHESVRHASFASAARLSRSLARMRRSLLSFPLAPCSARSADGGRAADAAGVAVVAIVLVIGEVVLGVGRPLAAEARGLVPPPEERAVDTAVGGAAGHLCRTREGQQRGRR